ncbi:hypothetical protein B4U80_13418 [Leptotrombidium deliense]|uniref:Ig-like domain-containing protein n=1 Tax=Leptotrombidium deliense TaxID=299467 RepID=A0A443S6Q5_9ACAR|nr:hypothetical protein B4U80_13418 [Leptotrombidium deliense]
MTLTCIVSGDPAPKVSWYRDIMADIEILPSSNVEMITYRDKTVSISFVNSKQYNYIYNKLLLFHILNQKMESFNSTLVYNRVTEAEDGQFKCKADNEYGTDSAFIDVDIVSMRKEYSNITECCVEQGVDSDCLKACSKDENDIDFVLNKPHCLTKINKIVSCAFDGKDNRQCCRRKQVPDECIHWCFGIENELEFCLLGSVKQIISCFTNETSVDSNRVNNNLNEHAVKRRVARLKSHKNYVLAVVLFTTVLALISIAVIAAMIYYNKKYMRRTTNNNNEDVIGFENQTYLKDTDSVNLRTQSSTTQQSNQNTTSTA